MSHSSRFGVSTARRLRGFSFLEVLLVLGIIGLMIVCIIGFFLSLHKEPLHPPAAKPAAASPAPKATPAEAQPAP